MFIFLVLYSLQWNFDLFYFVFFNPWTLVLFAPFVQEKKKKLSSGLEPFNYYIILFFVFLGGFFSFHSGQALRKYLRLRLMAFNGKDLDLLAHTILWFMVVLVLLLGSSPGYATLTDIYCLKTIKQSLKDPNEYLISWDFNNNTEGFICKFTGVDCWHPDENKVLNIRLSDMGLEGEFPRGIENCSSLTGLDLSSNKLSGPIPSNISKILKYVTSLDLSSNRFSGEIPLSLANCTYLNVLKLNNNKLKGNIPLQLGQLNRIKVFSVANNLLTGPVPTFQRDIVTKDDYANNLGLCGKPLESCPGIKKKTRTGIIAAAAAGGIAFTSIIVGISLYYYSPRVMKRKKEDEEMELG